ncbi:ATP-dependent RNA helicase DDX1 [Pelomyxa schiedti]|nr:ATP-dependent RNA helicase DDX1 [Pelomyxa schiedti]
MFSATLHSEEIKQAAQTMCRFPTWVDLKGKDSVPTTVDHAVVYINPDKPPKNLVSHQITTDGMHGGVVRDLAESKSHSTKLLKAKVLLKVIDAFKMSQCIVFCRTKIDCDNLENFLLTVGGGKRHVPSRGESDFGQGVYSCVVVHADRPPAERQTNLHSFKSGEVRFLITTDLGARGIDISEVPYVINYTLPDKPEDYIHRVGRVGRADRMGLAISLVSTCPEKVWYHTCPSKGKSCGNRALRDEGGCAIWWNEPEYWSSIQQRLGMTVPQLDDNFQLPSAASTERYGQRRGEENTFVSHSGEIRDKVTQLATLEDSVQLNFWSLKGAFRF